MMAIPIIRRALKVSAFRVAVGEYILCRSHVSIDQIPKSYVGAISGGRTQNISPGITELYTSDPSYGRRMRDSVCDQSVQVHASILLLKHHDWLCMSASIPHMDTNVIQTGDQVSIHGVTAYTPDSLGLRFIDCLGPDPQIEISNKPVVDPCYHFPGGVGLKDTRIDTLSLTPLSTRGACVLYWSGK
jgi:hypothetical protein